jgi:uncharacterized protein
MKFAVLFEDDPNAAPDLRRNHMAAHLIFLAAHSGQIKAAGPLKTSDGQPAGGLWLVEAGSVSNVEQLVRDDPFWPSGLRKSVRILHWTEVFADGQPLGGT